MRTIQELLCLNERVACVTGATGHIGKVFCETLLESKIDLIMIDLDENKLQSLRDEFRKKFKTSIDFFACDLSKNEDRLDLIDKLNKQQRVDILINCAAFVGDSDLRGWSTSFEDQDPKLWETVIELNLTAAFHLSQGLKKMLSENKKGVIINISSIYGFLAPDPLLYKDINMNNPAAYSASKAGLIQLTKWLSSNLAPEIRVNAISPGGIIRNQPEIFIKRYEKKTPLSRMGTEEDLKGALIFLASDLSEYVTGQNIIIDGGLSIS